MRVIITRAITKLKQKIYKHDLKKQTAQYKTWAVCFFFWMNMTFDFKFLKKIKKAKPIIYIYFIYFNLLFFCVKKKSVVVRL